MKTSENNLLDDDKQLLILCRNRLWHLCAVKYRIIYWSEVPPERGGTCSAFFLRAEKLLCLTSLLVGCRLFLCSDWLPGQRSQQSSHPTHSRSQGCGHRHSQGSFQNGHWGPSKVGGGHARQHGHSHGQGEQNGYGGVDGHNLAKFGKRHNDTEEEGDRGDHCGDGTG